MYVWKRAGFSRLSDLVLNGKLRDKVSFEEQAGVRFSWHSYLQLKNLIELLASKGIFDRSYSSLEVVLRAFTDSSKGLLAALYKVLIATENRATLKHQFRWQEDLQEEISEQMWSDIWNSPASRSRNFNVRLQFFKLITRWYFTPDKLNKMNPALSPLCWKKCGHTGSYLHCWWECPVIHSFWEKVIEVISGMTSLNLPVCPKLVLFDRMEEIMATKVQKDLISKLLAAARLTIAAGWKDSSPPLIQSWHDKIWDLFILDKLTQVTQATSVYTSKAYERFVATWFVVLQYMSEKDIIPSNTAYIPWIRF